MSLQNLVRENIKRLKPYSSAKSEFGGAAKIFLDANENSFGSPLNVDYSRYPDILQTELKQKIAVKQNVKANEIFIGHGSDEAIDLLFRIFCEPRRDNILICPPTYGMYEVSADINDIEIKRANLTAEFELDVKKIEKTVDKKTKLLFICSPNNPTGNSFDRRVILEIAKSFGGIVVVDEAYIHFSSAKSLVSEINDYQNLVVLQTFSKAWGLAGLRVGAAFANADIIELFNNVKPPYNISSIARRELYAALEEEKTVKENIAKIIIERENLTAALRQCSVVKKVFPSDANFVLAKTTDANSIYKFLLEEKIVVRNRNHIELCENCLRITVGTPDENKMLLKALKKYEKSFIY